MNEKQESVKDRADNEILFSKTVKAGKRIYYIDVKRDRKGEFYLSMTESKRIKEQNNAQYPTFEKHKLFLYREDIEKFMKAFSEAADFAQTNASLLGNAEKLAVAQADAENSNQIKEAGLQFEIEF